MRTGPGSPLGGLLLRIAVLGVLVAAAVGLRAGSPLHADGRAWRFDDLLNRGATAVQVVVVLVALLALLLLVMSLLGPRRRPVPPVRRHQLLSLFVFAVIVLVALALAPPPDHAARIPRPRRERPGPLPTATPGPVAVPHPASHQGIALLVVLMLVALLTSAFAVRRRRTEPVVLEPDEPDLVADGLAAAARVLRDRVQDDPRERVVSAYAAFEDALAAGGVERGPSGTPTALLQRAVAAGAPAGAAAELTRLFGAARFGDEPVTERDVTAAERALDELLVTR